jgi:hypothetical protein
MKYLQILVGCLITVLVSCETNTVQPSRVTPYERWKSFQLHNYTIDQVQICFCGNSGDTVRIIIRSDTIASMVTLSNNAPVPFPISQTYKTVDSLFAIIHTMPDNSIVATYHATYGYPESLDINPQLHPVDGGVLYETFHLVIP